VGEFCQAFGLRFVLKFFAFFFDYLKILIKIKKILFFSISKN